MNDFDEIFERFCIMAEQEDVGELKAIRYIKEKYGEKIAIKIWEDHCKGGKNEKQSKHR